ncbi:MAG: 23S rRNA (uracil(1939)-C(5))-methyltransferase RlmD [Terracidiphilus sp.]|jgi:23S rRNA (uracil1939-C5)-methyltransferase
MTPRKPQTAAPQTGSGALSPRQPFDAEVESHEAASSESHLVEITKPVYGGDFLARVEGKAVFVPLTLPGEQTRVRVRQNKRGYAAAEAEQIVTIAPERIAPACQHFGACGGCHYQHADYETQLEFKRAILLETLTRASVQIPGEVAILSADPWQYRNRIRLAFDDNGNPGYRGRRSHAVIPIRECPIATPLLLHAAQVFADVARAAAPSLLVTELALFCDPAQAALQASIFTSIARNHHFDRLIHAWRERVPALIGAELLLESRKVKNGEAPRTVAQWGGGSLTYRAAGFDYRVDSGAFFQVNRWLVDALVDRVTCGQKGSLAWDLFAGVGLFARALTANFTRVVAVESASSATQALAANLKGTRGAPVRSTTLDFLQSHLPNAHRLNLTTPDSPIPDLIVVDPPRTGLGSEITALLVRVAAPALVYVSCDPATLARDLNALLKGGYEIESITLADLFPQTFHLETVVHLRRA